MSANQPVSYQHENEKGDLKHVEGIDSSSASVKEDAYVVGDTEQERNAHIDDGYDPEVIKRITRKIDLRLLPILSAMYCISLIDRNNLSQARAANGMYMNQELGLTIGQRYSIITLAFFPPYILFEIPSQIGLRKVGARFWLSGAVVAWGFVMLGMGFVQNWSALVALRVLLGIFEAVLFPGASYLISCWYPRKQMALRMTIFYISSLSISGLSATLTYGLATLHGRLGRAGWRWVFILTGVLTVLIGILAFFLISEFPESASFLSEEEREIVLTRIERDRNDSVYDPLTKKKLLSYVLDVKLWIYGVMFMATTLGIYSFSYFLPRILESMGFTNIKALLLVAPPYVWAAIPAIFTAWIADHFQNMRGTAVAINASCMILGTCLYSQLPVRFMAGRYVGVFLAVSGCNANAPLILSWAQTSIRAQSKRGYASALIVGMGGVGGIVAAMSFQEKEAAQGYPTGVYLSLGLNAFVVVACFCLQFWYSVQNRRADRGLVVLEHCENFRYHL